MTPSKIDTCKIILLKNRTVRLKDTLLDTNLLTQKLKKTKHRHRLKASVYKRKINELKYN